MTKTKYLSLIISTDSIKIDLTKVDAIKQWDTSICVRKIRFFIGFHNFYCQFIKNFFKIAKPRNTLTKKNVPFAWTEKCDLAFKKLKQCVCKTLILIYFDFSKPCHFKIESSDYISAGMLSQKSNNGNLYPVAYFLKKIVPAEYMSDLLLTKVAGILRLVI